MHVGIYYIIIKRLDIDKIRLNGLLLNFKIRKATHRTRLYSMWGSSIYTFGSSWVLQSSCTVLRFILWDLLEKAGELVEISE